MENQRDLFQCRWFGAIHQAARRLWFKRPILSGGGHAITFTGPLGTSTFTFPTNLPSSPSTASRFFIVGTSNLAIVPGGIVPNYVFTNTTAFFTTNGGTINFAGVDSVTYTNLPADGAASQVRSGSSMVFSATNSPVNFLGQTNSIVPMKFLSANFNISNAVFSFTTATGVNGGTGPNYALQTSANFPLTNWTTISNITGNGSTKTISISPTGLMQVFRLKSP